MNNNHIKQLVLVIAILIITLASFASYAYFVANVNGNEQSKQTVITTGNMELILTDGEQVTLNNAIPGTSVIKTFKVKNIGTVETTYNVYLSELVNTFDDKNDLVYTLTSPNGCANSNEIVMPSVSEESSKLVSMCQIGAEKEHEYELVVTFKDDGTNQDNNKGKKFATKISINEYKQKVLTIIENMNELALSGNSDLSYDGIETLGENGTIDNNLRYIGSNPSNYIYYNCSTTNADQMNDETCEKWRIIGLFNNIEDDNGNIASRIKIIKDDFLGENVFSYYTWDTSDTSVNSGKGVNQWGESTYEDGTPYEGADLMRELNTDYLGNMTIGTDGYWYRDKKNYKYGEIPEKMLNLNAQNMIQIVKWNTGATVKTTYASDYLTKNMYTYERSENTGKNCKNDSLTNSCTDTVRRTTSWVGKVALIYPSDYGYSTTGGINTSRQECLNTTLSNWSRSEVDDCKHNSWFYQERQYITTLTPAQDPSNAMRVYYIGINGYLLSTSPMPSKLKPALYLKNEVGIIGGNGSESNPYKLTM